MAEKVTNEDHALHVKMFGGFDMTYLGNHSLVRNQGKASLFI